MNTPSPTHTPKAADPGFQTTGNGPGGSGKPTGSRSTGGSQTGGNPARTGSPQWPGGTP